MSSRYWVWTETSDDDERDSLSPSPTGTLKKRGFIEELKFKKKPSATLKKTKIRETHGTKRSRETEDGEKGGKRVRESYACLRHRAMHKRCPGDCPDRRVFKPQKQRSVIKNETTFKISMPEEPQPMACTPHEPKLEPSTFVPPVSFGLVDDTDSFNWESLVNWGEHGTLGNCWDIDDFRSSSSWEQSKKVGYNNSPSDDSSVTSCSSDDSTTETLWSNTFLFGEGSPSENMSCGDLDSYGKFHLNSTSKKENVGGDTLSRIILTSETLENWLPDPYFNSMVRGFYARCKVGNTDGLPVYRIGQIMEAKDFCFDSYRLAGKESTKGLLMQFGSHQTLVPLTSVLSTPPSDKELEDWRMEMERTGIYLTEEEIHTKLEIFQILNSKNSFSLVH